MGRVAAGSDAAQEQRASAIVEGQLGFVSALLRDLGVPKAGVGDAGQLVFMTGARRFPEIRRGSDRLLLNGSELFTAPAMRRKRRGSPAVRVAPAAGRGPPADVRLGQDLVLLERTWTPLPLGLHQPFVLCRPEEHFRFVAAIETQTAALCPVFARGVP